MLCKYYRYTIIFQELLAYGFSNTISSFFNCFMAAGSMSRTIIQESVGGHTQVRRCHKCFSIYFMKVTYLLIVLFFSDVLQVASLVNCAIILVVMFLIGPLFQQTPNVSYKLNIANILMLLFMWFIIFLVVALISHFLFVSSFLLVFL